MRIWRNDLMEAHGHAERTLVVIFLRGGADGLTLVPAVGDDHYHRARPVLGIRPENAIRIDDRFGLNPALRALEPMLKEGTLAVIHGAGSDDTTRSHFDAQDRMEHGGTRGGGWLGRYLLARGASQSALAAVAIGTTRPESLRGAPGGAVIQTVRDFGLDANANFVERLAMLYAGEQGPLGAAGRSTLDAVNSLRQMRADPAPPEHGARYPASAFGRGMREIARLVKADLGMVATTIDMVGGGLGWDTHFVQGQAIGALMQELAEGMSAFWKDLGSSRERVTVVCMTEFGRRVAENTSFGTDHGAGGAMFVLDEDLPQADVIIPGGVYAGWHSLAEGNLVGPGDVPVTTDYRAVLAPILQKHRPGIEIATVFPETVRGTGM
jgi:uncharacterized protein (DUF1501 family)